MRRTINDVRRALPAVKGLVDLEYAHSVGGQTAYVFSIRDYPYHFTAYGAKEAYIWLQGVAIGADAAESAEVTP